MIVNSLWKTYKEIRTEAPYRLQAMHKLFKAWLGLVREVTGADTWKEQALQLWMGSLPILMVWVKNKMSSRRSWYHERRSLSKSNWLKIIFCHFEGKIELKYPLCFQFFWSQWRDFWCIFQHSKPFAFCSLSRKSSKWQQELTLTIDVSSA